MKPTKILKLQTLKENLVDYLPAEQQQFAKTKAYEDLALSLFTWLVANSDDKASSRQAFQHQKANWDDFCKFEQKRIDGPKMNECGWESV